MTKKPKQDTEPVIETDDILADDPATADTATEQSPEEKMQAEINALQEEVKFLKNEYLKEQADLENVKKRLEKERVIERKYAALDVVKAFISPLDHFELALKHEAKNDEAKNFAKGFRMILDEIKKNLEHVGVSEIDAEGEDYDPNFHQAISKEAKDGIEPNKVIEVVQKGYMFKDRVIRPAMVKISE